MTKRLRHKVHSILALLLLAVFMGPMLYKPVHTLLAHHEMVAHAGSCGHHQHLITNQVKSCPVCSFEFYVFTLQQKVCLPEAVFIYHDQPTAQTQSCDIRQSSHIFQLRAPPVCSL